MQEQISTLSPEDVRTLPKKPYAVWWYAFPIVQVALLFCFFFLMGANDDDGPYDLILHPR